MSKKHVLYCQGSDICIVHVPVPVLFLFRYPHFKSSSTPSHPVPEGSTVNRYLHSHPIPMIHVIRYPHSMSSSTQFVRYQYCAHPLLQVIRYQKVLQVIQNSYSMSYNTQFMFRYLHCPCFGNFNVLVLVPSQSFSTNTFYNHLVPTLASTYICFPFSNQAHRVRHPHKVVPK
jgi:hypothetical protein